MADLYISYCTRCTPEKIRQHIDLFVQRKQEVPGVAIRLDGSDCHLECDGGPVQLRVNGKTQLYLEHPEDPAQGFDPGEAEAEVVRMIRETLSTAGIEDPSET